MSTTNEDAQVGYGAEAFYRIRNTTTPTAYLPMGTLVSIDGPNPTLGKVDITRLSDKIKRSAPLRPEKEVTFNIQHTGTDAACKDFQGFVNQAPTPTLDFQIIYPDGESDTFYGFPGGYSKSGVDGESVIMAAIPVTINSVVMTTAPGTNPPV